VRKQQARAAAVIEQHRRRQELRDAVLTKHMTKQASRVGRIRAAVSALKSRGRTPAQAQLRAQQRASAKHQASNARTARAREVYDPSNFAHQMPFFGLVHKRKLYQLPRGDGCPCHGRKANSMQQLPRSGHGRHIYAKCSKLEPHFHVPYGTHQYQRDAARACRSSHRR
jgi:hypothetical protein